VVAVQFPGRGVRLTEEPLTNIDALLPALMEGLTPALTKPYAFFGHSMGALIAFEVTRRLRRQKKSLPVHLFVSGRGGPRERDWDVKFSELPEAELVAELERYGGAPKEVLENTELIRLMLPTIRADFKLCETYSYVPEDPLDCPISACGGLEDFEVKQERLDTWRDETSAAFKLRMFPGGHFYPTSILFFCMALSRKSGLALGSMSVPPAVAGGSMMSMQYHQGFPRKAILHLVDQSMTFGG
jgi:medium-chain acyl-[acyl-carrier-protein] hydrolase